MLSKLAEFKENDLTQSVIVPLFQKMYGCRVVYTGGVREKGRDAIVYRRSPIGKTEFIGIQVKKQKLTANSSVESLQQLLNQLSQMSNEPVQCPDSYKDVDLSEHFFITPFEISESALQSHQGALQNASKVGLTVIDGKKLLGYIHSYAPELERVISGDQAYIGEKIKPSLSNSALMKALAFNNVRHICDIYCETKLSIGNSTHQDITYSNIHLNPKKSFISLKSTHDLNYLDTIRNYCLKELKFDIVEDDSFDLAKSNILSKNKHEADEKRYREALGKSVQAIRRVIESSNYSILYPTVSSWNEFCEFIASGYMQVKIELDESFLSEIEMIQKLIRERDNANAKLNLSRVRGAAIDSEQKVHLMPNQLIDYYTTKLSEVESLSGRISDNQIIKELLRTSKTLETLSSIITKFRDNLIFDMKKSKHGSNVKISIEDAFKTGLNIAVLGDAGSGKTTNLQHYTLKLLNEKSSDLTLYVTLSELASQIPDDSVKETSLVDAIYSYLNKLGTNDFSSTSFREHLANEGSVLIVDSVDEAIVQFPWIIEALKYFSEVFKKCQVITSSRFTVREISQLGFVNISLLPFNEQQKSDFFSKWFVEDNCKTKAILEHLGKYPKLNSVVNNPLSATIMATLQESSVPLPCTEAQLYKKRFDLLSGVFDRYKGINRNTVTPELLLNAIYHLAYKLHKDRERDFSRDQAIEYLEDFDSYETEPGLIFDELVSPCEIVLSTATNRYSFGHLRFQEYLASEHMLLIQRNIPLDRYIVMPWWHDVFVLYAQHAVEIESIINYVSSDADLTLNSFPLIRAMISFRSPKQQELLTKRIEIAYQNAQSESRQNKILSTMEGLKDTGYDDFDFYDVEDLDEHLDNFNLNEI